MWLVKSVLASHPAVALDGHKGSHKGSYKYKGYHKGAYKG